MPDVYFVFTECLINKETLSQVPGCRTGLGRGQWPRRALPGCPLGGGRVLILHTLGSLLPLFHKLKDMVFGWNSGSCGEKKD